jgi:flavodoxin
MNDKGKPNVQVIYYSRSGKTRLIAESVAKQLACDILEVIDLKDRSGILGFFGGIIDVRRRPITDITPSDFDFAAYDLLIVCSPIWGMIFPPAINTFFSKVDLTGKKVVIVADFTGRMRDATFDEYRDRINKAGGELIDQVKITTKGKPQIRMVKEAAAVATDRGREWQTTVESD